MSSAEYKSVSTNEGDQQQDDQRFERPQPPFWKRVALLAFLAFLFWLALYLQPGTKQEPTIIHATRSFSEVNPTTLHPLMCVRSRYSKEFKYRPAASPVITERLKDGRVRLRGAHPTF